MQDILIYGGIAVNVIGALYLLAYAMKYSYAFRQARNRPVETQSMKLLWAKKRIIGFGLMIAGLIIAIAGCMV